MRLLQILFSILWGAGYVGNGILFLYVEWTYLRQSFVQILNPFLQLQVFGTLLTIPLFWIFLAMAVLGYYAVTSIERRLDRSSQRSESRVRQAVSSPSEQSRTLLSDVENFLQSQDENTVTLEN